MPFCESFSDQSPTAANVFLSRAKPHNAGLYYPEHESFADQGDRDDRASAAIYEYPAGLAAVLTDEKSVSDRSIAAENSAR